VGDTKPAVSGDPLGLSGDPFGLSLSKPRLHHQPFDKLRANGGGPPFGLSLSKPCSTH